MLHLGQKYFLRLPLSRQKLLLSRNCVGLLTTSALAPANCWKCSTPLSNSAVPLCDSCGAVQPINEKCNFFAIFGLEQAVDIDKNAMERRFKELQRALHPDKFAYTQQEQPIPESSELEQNLDERALSAAASALVNKAYQTLREPVERLRYVLEEEGIAVLSESESSSNRMTSDKNTPRWTFSTSPALLMVVMELREDVEKHRGARDTASLQNMAREMQQQIEACLGAISVQYQDILKARRQRYGDGKTDDAILNVLAAEAVRLKYFSKIQEEIDIAIEHISDRE